MSATIKDLYEQILAEYREAAAHYQGRLDVLHHLIEAGLGHHEVPDTHGESAPATLHSTDTPTPS